MAIVLDGNSLTLAQVVDVAFNRPRLRLSPAARRSMQQSRAVVLKKVRQGEHLYGITTGFGKLSDKFIPPEEGAALQVNLLRSHACGVGEPLLIPDLRACMLIRANSMAKGFSGIRPAVAEILLQMLERGVHPVVPRQGSVGASGDLAPSAHMGLVMIGEGEAWFDGRRMPGGEALQRAGIAPLALEAKEGLSILNGTHFIAGVGALCLHHARRCLIAADVAGALSLEPLMGTPVAFDPVIQEVRPHKGQAETAEHLRRLLSGSGIIASHKACPRIQDAYSLRCMPQVHGAARDALRYVQGILETEVNSATDNPLVFAAQDRIISGGNFHGAPLAVALDLAAIALTQAATMSERRIERLVNPDMSGLSPFLTRTPGVSSGFMLTQIVAAALASENKTWSHPASVDTIPTSAGKEDHVSMGMHAALKCVMVVDNFEKILAIEMLCACQGLDLLALPGNPKPGRGTARAYRLVRDVVKTLEEDRPMADDIIRVRGLIRSGAFDRLF